MAALRRGRFEEAARLLREHLAEQPDDAAAWANLGVALYQIGRYGEALEAFERASQHMPDDARVWLNIGAAANQLGLLDQAEDALRRAIQLNSRLPGAHYNLAVLLAKRGRLAEAAAEAETELAYNPGHALARKLAEMLRRRIMRD